MVRGLDIFQEWFAAFSNQYVPIGGTAASLAMEEAGLEFRATKDLDIVLHVEALTADFGQAFWQFVETGGYEIRQIGNTAPRVTMVVASLEPRTLGAAMKDISGTLRTIIQGPGSSSAVAA
jgi:hypothetical protein